MSRDVNFICNLNKGLYQVVCNTIMTDEVIITEQQIAHVEEGHPGDYAKLSPFLSQAIQEPDYILRANKPNTAVIIKRIQTEGTILDVVLRLKVAQDPDEYKNSIITMWEISEKRFRRLLRQSEILYKRESL